MLWHSGMTLPRFFSLHVMGATAKSLGAGMPIGAVTGRADIMDAAHPGALRSLHVGDRIVAHVGCIARADTEFFQGSPKNLGAGLAVADLVRVGEIERLPQLVPATPR